MRVKAKVWRGVLAASASTIALTASTAVFAQDAAADQAGGQEVEEVVITGSRIARIGVDTVRPISAIGADVLDKRATTNLADAIRELPAAGFGTTPNGDQNSFTVGQSYVDLFNLGSQRTLTLVNGRRFVSSNVPTNFGSAAGLQVDYNVLPVALVKRIEVVPLAGAAVYGSDAIAGTINLILDDHYQGLEFSGQYGESYKSDLPQWQVQAVMGTDFAGDKGNVAFSVEYNKQTGALLSARPKWHDNRPLATQFGARLDADGDGDADQEYRIYKNQVVFFGPYGSVNPPGLLAQSIGLGAIGGKYYQFTQTGDLAQCTPGITPGASSALFAFSSTPGSICGMDLVGDTNQIRSPVERVNVSLLGHYELPYETRFFLESTFSNATATELVNQGGFNIWAFGGTSGPITTNTSNPFLSTQAASILNVLPGGVFQVNRLNNDIVKGGANETQNMTWRVATGFDGKFDVSGHKFTWETSAVFGHANIQNSTKGIVDGRFANAVDAVRVDDTYLNSLITATGSTITTDRNGDGLVNASDALIALQRSGQSGVQNIQRGSIICRINGNIANGTVSGFNAPVAGGAMPFATNCVPLNIFGDASKVNSQATLNWVTGGPRMNVANNYQRVLTANITGELFKLPAGMVSGNVGIEYRREQATFTPDLGSTITLTRGGFATYGQTGGQYDTKEYFGELLVPAVSPDMNIPFVNRLEFNASARRVSGNNDDINNLSDTSNDSTAYEYGGRYSPVKDLVFRGSYTQAIRAPSLVELYQPEVTGFSMANDPCDARFINGGLTPAIRAANCAAEGIPAGFTSIAVNQTIPILTSGNPNLTPEKSKSYTYGVVIQPRWVPRLAMTVDYFDIKIEDRISGLGLTQVLNACYDSPSYPTAPACSSSLFTRDAAHQINFGRTTSLNASHSEFRALQTHITYGFDVAEALNYTRLHKGGSDYGGLTFDWTLLRTYENSLQVLNEAPSNPVNVFTFPTANPNWKSTFDVTYTYGDWRFFWRTLWQSAPQFLSNDGSSYLVNLGPGQETTVATKDNIVRSFDDYWMNNASIQYTWRDKTSFQLSVNNVFNMVPSVYNRANASYYPGDQIGRYFIFRVRQQF